MTQKHQHDSQAGLIYATAAYLIWGFFPLYWRLLANVPALEITIHRVLWGAVFMAAFILARGRLMRILGALRDWRLLRTLLCTSVLISVNWGLFIWCVSSGQLVEASLGYYINPLFSIVLGVVLLHEHIGPFRRAAIGLAGVALLVQIVALGHFPWVALTLATSFAFYGYLRKTANIGAVDGLFVEASLLFPLTLALVGYWGLQGTGAFPAADWRTNALLILGGPITVLPLALFSAGARRIRLSTLGFLQYMSPSITLVLATVFFGERFTWLHAATFGFVWLALGFVMLERQPRRDEAVSEVGIVE